MVVGQVWVFPHNYLWGLQRMIWKRKNIQWAAVLWSNMPHWCQRSEKSRLTIRVCRRASLIVQSIKPWTGQWQQQKTTPNVTTAYQSWPCPSTYYHSASEAWCYILMNNSSTKKNVIFLNNEEAKYRMLFQWVTVGVADGHICDTVSVFKWCLMKKTKQNKTNGLQCRFPSPSIYVLWLMAGDSILTSATVWYSVLVVRISVRPQCQQQLPAANTSPKVTTVHEKGRHCTAAACGLLSCLYIIVYYMKYYSIQGKQILVC